MTSKLGESPRKSAAAYLLFYRRRSDKPLGPQYLQDLVTEFRNPPQQAHSADEASESESGKAVSAILPQSCVDRRAIQSEQESERQPAYNFKLGAQLRALEMVQPASKPGRI